MSSRMLGIRDLVNGMVSSQSCMGCVLGFVTEVEMKKVGFEGFKVVLRR